VTALNRNRIKQNEMNKMKAALLLSVQFSSVALNSAAQLPFNASGELRSSCSPVVIIIIIVIVCSTAASVCGGLSG